MYSNHIHVDVIVRKMLVEGFGHTRAGVGRDSRMYVGAVRRHVDFDFQL